MASTAITPSGAAVKRQSRFAGSPMWGTIACGAGLFSDGYLNAIIGPVGTILTQIYGKAFSGSTAYSNVYSIAFAGTIVGQLFFGWTSDHVSRKWSLMVSTVILIIFAILAAGSYSGGTLEGMLRALAAYRFFIGIGIGGEYPAGSVGAAEHSGGLKEGTRNRMFILFTNVQIDLGFLLAPLTAMIVVLATTENHLRAAWRICLGLGVVPPLSLFFLRMKISEPEPYTHEKMTIRNTPWGLCFRFYGFRLAIVSLIWFIYDFSAYSFGLYSTQILKNLNGGTDKLWVTLGWSTLLNFFYMPGCILGSFMADSFVGAKKTLIAGQILQAVVGFAMAARYEYLAAPGRIGGFVVVYGLFLALGEMGPGDNIGLFASKTSCTSIRGKYYGVAAAVGKIGAYVGSWVFPEIGKLGGTDATKSGQYQFYVGASLSIFAACLALFLPELHQDVVANEDIRFREYLQAHGYDTTQMGIPGATSTEQILPVDDEKLMPLSP